MDYIVNFRVARVTYKLLSQKKKKSHCTFSSHTYAWISPYCFYIILAYTKSLVHKVNLLTDLLDLALLFTFIKEASCCSTENHKQSKWRLVEPCPSGYSYKTVPHLRVREEDMEWKWYVKARGSVRLDPLEMSGSGHDLLNMN